MIHRLAPLIMFLVLPTQVYAATEINILTPEHGIRTSEQTLWLVASTTVDPKGMVAVLRNKDTVKKIKGEVFKGEGLFVFHTLLRLETGLNEVSLGEKSVSIVYKTRYRAADKSLEEKGVPKGYKRYLFHKEEIEARCMQCHEIHGTKTKAGSGPPCLHCHEELLSVKYLHGPLGAGLSGPGGGACIVCHDAQSAPSRFVPKFGGGGELCLGCHEKMRTLQREKKYFHGPVGVGQCTACHDPHGSSLKLQLAAEGDRLCYLCHDQQRIVQGKTVVHGVVQSEGCAACHNPHASDYKAHLMDAERDLCSRAGCHPRFATITEDHPVRNHPVTGKYGPERRLSCSSCHDPHSSDFALRLPGDKRTFCSHCHEDPRFFPDE